MKMIKVLDKGYVRLVDSFGDDLRVVNAARASYEKESKQMTEKDEKLIRFLAEHKHTSPFRHSGLVLEVRAPLMVARQWWKYVIGSDHQEISLSYRDPMLAWNESSRRYVTENPEFYLPQPGEWRMAPENKKQGSGGYFSEEVGESFTKALEWLYQEAEQMYNWALEHGVAPEMARLFLPAYGLYVRWYWTCSLQGALHFLDQRLSHDAQKEIQLYAQAVDQIVGERFPLARKYWRESQGKGVV